MTKEVCVSVNYDELAFLIGMCKREVFKIEVELERTRHEGCTYEFWEHQQKMAISTGDKLKDYMKALLILREGAK